WNSARFALPHFFNILYIIFLTLSKFFYPFYDTLFSCFLQEVATKFAKNAEKPVRKNLPISLFFWQEK
ncbi:hypothetical protein, partial [Anaerotignum faecicola]